MRPAVHVVGVQYHFTFATYLTSSINFPNFSATGKSINLNSKSLPSLFFMTAITVSGPYCSCIASSVTVSVFALAKVQKENGVLYF